MRGRTVRRFLLPHVLRFFTIGLVAGALLLTLFLMTRLAVDLINETNRLNTVQLNTDQGQFVLLFCVFIYYSVKECQSLCATLL